MPDMVFLGAGASVEFGVPAAFGMTDQLLEWARESDSHDGRVSAILQFVAGKLGLDRGERVNVEDLFSAVSSIAERENPLLAPFVESWLAEINDLDAPFRAKHDNTEKPGFVVAMGWLFIHLKRLTIYAKHSNTYYPAFVAAARDNGATIATVNYDNAVELGGEAVGAEVSDGYVAWKRSFEFDFGHAVPLLKLHGSTTWGMGMRPTLVFGSGNKLRYYGPFLDLLADFKQRLFASTTLRVIGYSFGDSHINEIFRRWEYTHDNARLVVVDVMGRDATQERVLTQGLGARTLTIESASASEVLPRVFEV